MALLTSPAVTKFFSNKIESSRPEWGDYLLEVADIFSTFDGEDLDRGLLEDRFSVISGRSPYALRDVANFRDEFGAYGTYLGLYRIELVDGQWKIFLSQATKHFLCSTEPDVESFCRTQMALFQYPNGAGHRPATAGVQGNVKADTIREIQNGIRINPLRLLCKVVVALHEVDGIPLSEISISYPTILMLMNDDRVNQAFSPPLNAIHEALKEYELIEVPDWAKPGRVLTNFKRNFHIFEWTGLFRRSRHNGIHVADGDHNRIYQYIKTISNMTHNFQGFEPFYNSGANVDANVRSVIIGPSWGRYFDSLTMPMDTLTALSEGVSDEDTITAAPTIGSASISDQPFPGLRTFQANQIRAFNPTGNRTDPFETAIRREKANREHERILNLLAATLRARGYEVFENTFIDLYSDADGTTYIFEIKSNNSRNVLSQIRKAVAQLYEYRYRSDKKGAVLCIVLQEKPPQEWVIDYLLNDRGILLCWLVDDVRLECPAQCYGSFSSIGIVH